MISIKKELSDRNVFFNENDKLHRTDGPAVEYDNGTKEWWINGERHRENGPAIEYSDGFKLFFLDNYMYSEQEWEQEIAKIKLKRILDL
jgi:hypothetical protein